MSRSNLAKQAARRAIIWGALMALIVFGGAIFYLFDSRPRSYRAEGGDFWMSFHYYPPKEKKALLVQDLSRKVRSLDFVEGFWGMELLQGEQGEITLLTRWQNEDAYVTFSKSEHAKKLAPDPTLSIEMPTTERQIVLSR